MGIQNILGNILIYPYLLVFVLYIIGRPKFIVSKLAYLLDIRIYYDYSLQTISLILFSLGIIGNLYSRSKKLEELYIKPEEKLDIHDQRVYHLKEAIFHSERGAFLYLTFLILTLVFIKFSDVYKKKYNLEDELQDLKKSEEKSENAKKTD